LLRYPIAVYLCKIGGAKAGRGSLWKEKNASLRRIEDPVLTEENSMIPTMRVLNGEVERIEGPGETADPVESVLTG
jgi:hypothetical protein